MNMLRIGISAIVLFGFFPQRAVACPGDCDADGVVGIEELMSGVGIALGDGELSVCAAMDSDGDGAVTVHDLIRAVASALDGCPAEEVLVTTASGTVRGYRRDGVARFLGIPFAAPPVGDRRWAPPQPVEPWEDVLDAGAFGPACPQGASLQSIPSTNEDCLHLNVWVPEVETDALLPVMFWIHGGGNQNGSTRDQIPFIGGDFYDGTGLADTGGVIVVTTNYRLGVFGFFAHEALAAENPMGSFAGNQGLLDQRLALEWVRDNVAAFGGDPDNVTIFGESAGSWNVCFHMVSPGSQGLFHSGISQSGGCTVRQPTAEEGAAQAAALTAELGCGDAGDPLACLRALSVRELLDTAGSFDVVVDGTVVPDQPSTLYDTGAFARVPYILGSNRDEGTLFAIGREPVDTEEEYRAELAELVGDRVDEAFELYHPDDFPSINDALIRAQGDAFLVCTTTDVAIRAANAGAEVYAYNFDRPIPIPGLESLGATHGAEIAYVFGSADASELSPEDLALSETMRRYWSRFASSGNPNGGSDPEWPLFDPTDPRRINFDVEVSVVQAFRAAECTFWRSIYEADL